VAEIEAGVGRLEDLYATHSEAATRLAYVLTGNRAVAEDLTQEAFVRICGRYADLRDPERLGGYLFRTITNLARSRARRAHLHERILSQRTPTAVEPVDIDRREELWRALMQLPIRQRAAIFLRYYQDMSEVQAADALGCSPSAVRSLVAHAMQKLRKQVVRDG
jgi:RNA polymerase sigma-70 factor (sigma-E family)